MTSASWTVELLGPEASDVGFQPRPHPGGAEDTAAYLVYRGTTIAAAGAGNDGAQARLREKVEAHLEALRALPEIPAVQELNLVRRTLGGESRRVRVRPMDAQRALLEYDLGIDPSVLFHDVGTRTYSLVWREPSGSGCARCCAAPCATANSPTPRTPWAARPARGAFRSATGCRSWPRTRPTPAAPRASRSARTPTAIRCWS
ncbi:MAG: hypothetical protein ACYS26_14910 [Planctomycetota bacterium]